MLFKKQIFSLQKQCRGKFDFLSKTGRANQTYQIIGLVISYSKSIVSFSLEQKLLVDEMKSTH